MTPKANILILLILFTSIMILQTTPVSGWMVAIRGITILAFALACYFAGEIRGMHTSRKYTQSLEYIIEKMFEIVAKAKK
jgi:hypothetical protein